MCISVKLQRMMPAVLEGSFEFFVNILGNAMELLSIDLLDSLLAILMEYTKERKMHGLPHKVPAQMHKHLLTFLKLLLSSATISIREQAFGLARAALMSTGAFSRNWQEIDAWFIFLPGFLGKKSSSILEEIKVLQSSSRAVVTFFCDAISYVANNLFKSWDFLRQCILKRGGAKGFASSLYFWMYDLVDPEKHFHHTLFTSKSLGQMFIFLEITKVSLCTLKLSVVCMALVFFFQLEVIFVLYGLFYSVFLPPWIYHRKPHNNLQKINKIKGNQIRRG